jgi:hypothetical protein
MPEPTITTDQICERVLARLEVLTPTSGPSSGFGSAFVRHSDRTAKIENVTDPGRLRLVEVRVEAPKIGTFAANPGASKTNYSGILAIKIGYSAEVWETLEDEVEYRIQDLMDEDLEQIRRFLDTGSPFGASGDLAALVGVKLNRFETATKEAGGKVFVIRYSIHYGRGY